MNALQQRLFICRFWIAYFQARLWLLQAFPPDGEYRGT
jgi:hypothetical protein